MSRRRSRYTPPPEVRPAPPDKMPWVHHFDIEDVVACAVAYRSRHVARKHYGVCFDAGYRALRDRHPEASDHDLRVETSRIITATTKEHTAFFHYEMVPGEELWPAGWYVDDVKVDEAEQRARADELRALIAARRAGHA